MTAFESVGAILVVTLLIVPAATAYLLTDRLWVMVALTVGDRLGRRGRRATPARVRVDASIAGAMGLVCAACFALALLASPRYGLVVGALRRRRGRAAAAASPQGG